MESRVGRYFCLVVDEENKKLDLFRTNENPSKTQLFDSVKEAEFAMREKDILGFTIGKIEVDTF
jgi:hypothetical protein